MFKNTLVRRLFSALFAATLVIISLTATVSASSSYPVIDFDGHATCEAAFAAVPGLTSSIGGGVYSGLYGNNTDACYLGVGSISLDTPVQTLSFDLGAASNNTAVNVTLSLNGAPLPGYNPLFVQPGQGFSTFTYDGSAGGFDTVLIEEADYIAAHTLDNITFGDSVSQGCYIDAPESVDEDATFTATVRCDSVDDLYGFQLGTTLSGNASTAATGYTLGEFDTNSVNPRLTVGNTLDLFSQAHTGNDISDGSYTLGSYEVSADKYLLADGSVSITLDDFLASDSSGAVLDALAAAPDATVTVNNIILTLLQGDVTVASDGSMTNVSNAAISLDGTTYPVASGAGGSVAVAVNQEGGQLDIAVTADMDSHLACTETKTIADGINDVSAAIGTLTLLAGDVVSVGGDAAINLQDAVAVGAAFGGAASGEEDVNGNGTVDIFDLVHIGRNYNASNVDCSGN
jgi:hypothetical protein